MWLKSFHDDYFNFSRSERFGLIVLSVCLLITFAIKCILPYLLNGKTFDSSAFAHEIEAFREAIAESDRYSKEQIESSYYDEQSNADLFAFDPNLSTDADFTRLGFNERQIRNIRNYQASGGSFKRKEDLQKLYTISTIQYQRLEPYIRIVGKETTRETYVERKNIESYQKPAKPVIELNTADSSLLTQLSGIGPVLATRALRYRNLIGGFTEVAQLSEVYGISDELIERLSPQLSIDSSQIKKIPLNTVLLNDLKRHPYINEQQARGILNYRRLQNRIVNLEELVRNNILDAETAAKIRPYLSFD